MGCVMSDTLTQAWADIRRRHRTVPKASVAVAPGKSRSTCGSVAWTEEPVLLASAETLAQEPVEILGWLLHQAAHALAGTRLANEGRTPSKSREGRYHGKAFKDAATELGLEVETEPNLGWSRTTVPPELAASYSAVLERLRAAGLRWTPPVPPTRAAQSTRPGNQIVAWCSCSPPRRIRVTASTFERGSIRCEVCGREFKPSQ
jgi:hypothetical protein